MDLLGFGISGKGRTWSEQKEILARVFNYANCAYYGSLKKGEIHTGYEVVTRLGMAHTKAMIILLAMQLLARDDKDVEVVFARCFSSAVLGKILSEQFGMREDQAKKAELGGLFSEIGRMILQVYRKFHAENDDRIDETFIDRYHIYLTERIIDIFALPDYLQGLIFHGGVVVEANYLTLGGILQLAIDAVAESFRKEKNCLVLEVQPMPAGQDLDASIEHIVACQYAAVGLSSYLKIINGRERLLPPYESAKQKNDH